MTTVNVLETNVLHASDIIYWVDGTTAVTEAKMGRLHHVVVVILTTRPTDLKMLNSIGKTAFWRKFDGKMVEGVADEADKTPTNLSTYTLAGTVDEPYGLYNPRTFEINSGTGAGHTVVMYPTPLGTRFGKSGGLKGTLRWSSTESPVPWAILSLQVTTGLGAPLLFHAQADRNGDFILPMRQVPPLPEGITQYSAVLSVEALESADADNPLNPGDLLAMTLGDPESEGTFSAGIRLSVVPGEIRLLRSFEKDHLSVQPSSP